MTAEKTPNALTVSVDFLERTAAGFHWKVTVADRTGVREEALCHTNSDGHGLWVDGRQAMGTFEFLLPDDPSAARRVIVDFFRQKWQNGLSRRLPDQSPTIPPGNPFHLPRQQQTIGREILISGPALHSNENVTMKILPQPSDCGIRFRRADLPETPALLADCRAVIDTRRCVTIGTAAWRISTIEHLMGVFHGLGIDNALVEVDDQELPAGDGSGLDFAAQILAAGTVVQNRPRRYFRPQCPVWVEAPPRAGEFAGSTASIIILPADRLEIDCTYDSAHPVVGSQYHRTLITPESFLEEIGPARTIAFQEEIEALRGAGLAQSDDYRRAVVVGDSGYLRELRYLNEIVRHKILDILGDLYLLGPVLGRIVAIRPGHALNRQLVREMESKQDCVTTEPDTCYY